MHIDKEFLIISEFEVANENIFLKGKPFKKPSKTIKYRSKEHLEKLLYTFKNSRPNTKKEVKKNKQVIPDNAVYVFIGSKFNFKFSEIKNVRYHHNIAMDAENKIGYLLEEYIYQNIRDNGWIWCTGSILRSIDFIKKESKNKKIIWKMLQVKNSDNSENSSSNKVRDNTPIEHWFRRFSKKDEYNWSVLREITNSENLSEENFLEFLRIKAKT